MRAERLLIQTTLNGHQRSLIWDGHHPIALAQPFGATLLLDSKGVLIRESEMDGRPGQEFRVTSKMIDEACTVRMKTSRGGYIFAKDIRISRANALLPVMASANRAGRGNEAVGSRLQLLAFTCNGQTVSSTDVVKQRFTARTEGKSVFRLTRSAKKFDLVLLDSRVEVALGNRDDTGQAFAKRQRISFVEAELGALEIRWNQMTWRFALVPEYRPLAPPRIEDDPETRYFRKAIEKATVAFGAFCVLIALWPSQPEKKKQTEQVSRIVFNREKLVIKKPEPPKPPEPVPVPEPKPEPTQVAEVRKPEPPKPVKQKPTPPKPKPIVAQAKPPMPKPAPPRPAPPKPIAAKPLPPVAPKPVAKAPPPPAPVKTIAPPPARSVAPVVAAKPVLTPPRPAAPIPAPKPAGPTPEQIAARQAEIARVEAQRKAEATRARLGAALGFISDSPKQVDLKAADYSKTRNTALAAATGGRSLASASQPSAVLVAMSQQGVNDAGGAIATTGARGIRSSAVDAGAGTVGGRGKGLNQVLGKVRLPGAGGGGGSWSSLGESGLTMQGQGKINQALLEKILAKYLDRFQYCYEKALLSDSSLAGNVMVSWTIALSGSPSAASVIKSQLNNSPLHDCLCKEIQRITFPAPEGGAVIVKYPFSFSSTAL